MLNRLRAQAQGDEMYTVLVTAWADNVSGHASKQMNAHKNIYVTNGSLPGRLLQQEFHVKFAITSQHASTAEQAKALREMVKYVRLQFHMFKRLNCWCSETHERPRRVYNAHTKHMCSFRLVVPNLPSDNPQASEEASHIGPGGNCKCRKCKVGGVARYVESDNGFHSLHEVDMFAFTSLSYCCFTGCLGELRTVDDTREIVLLQLDTAAGTRQLDPIKRLQTESGIKDKVTQGWI
ncbi:MAG TPA: hypothetical protein VGO47_04720, partial [Chlamydiales bacterium]|nr:hypothetical protein [Chlamydiales bacterium]